METDVDWLDELHLQIRDRRDPWVVLEGRRAVEAAIGGWWDVVGILAGEDCVWEPPQWSGLELRRCSQTDLEMLTDDPFHQGVIGLARQPEETADVAGLMAELADDDLVVVCPFLAEASNAGAVIRSAAALGAAAVLFGEDGASPFHPRSVRSSEGSLFRIPIRVADGGQILRSLKAAGFSLLGTAGSSRDAVDLSSYEPSTGRLAVVIESETAGLGRFWSAACDDLIRIPLASGTDSLTPGSISALMLWEISRCREFE